MGFRDIEIIYNRLGDQTYADPLSAETLSLEKRLRANGLNSGRPLKNRRLPPGTVGLRHERKTVLARSNGPDIVEILGAANAGPDFERLIDKL